MTEKDDIAKDETRLNELQQQRGAIHDCSEAGCSFDPEGNPITSDNPGQLKPAPSTELKTLYEKVTGKKWPEKAAEPVVI